MDMNQEVKCFVQFKNKTKQRGSGRAGGNDKTNSKSENPTKIKVRVDFYRFSDVPHRK